MKQVPKHIKAKIARMGALMERIVCLNAEVETWCEKNGVEYAYDLTDGNRDDRGYGLWDEKAFIKAIENAINGVEG